MEQENNSQALISVSDAMADAVAIAAASTATVHARRRMSASGILWSDKGLIVSASHVVERDDDITVTLPDGETVPAQLVGRDQGSDIVLLKVDRTDLTPISRVTTPARPGALALAVGRPGQSGPMASLGVVSMIGGPWKVRDGSQIDSYIRSDAAMLPGFSGGPLINPLGEAYGMNSSSVGRRGGLTITYEALEKTVGGLAMHGKIRRGYLGIGAQSVPLNSRLKEDLALDQDRGLVVVSLESDGPAENAGLLLGDVIVSLQSLPVGSVEELQNRLVGDLVDKPATLRIIRAGQAQDIEVVAAEKRS